MMYHLENEQGNHFASLKVALKNFVSVEPDIAIITEDGSKIFTQRILLSMYSNTFSKVLTDMNTSELPTIFLPLPNSSPVEYLLTILTQGIVFSTDSDVLLDVGKAAQFLGISGPVHDPVRALAHPVELLELSDEPEVV